jgi:modulator of FtsH protease
MDSRYQHPSFGGSLQPATTEATRVAFLRKVYLLMTGAVVISGLSAAVASTVGTPVAVGAGLALPPAIAFFLQHPIVGFVLLIGGTFGTSFVARKPGVNVVALFGLSALVGFVIAPAIYFAQLRASMGATLSSAPVLHAFGLAAAGFTGLSAYALTTKRDFSAIGGFLGMGLFVVIGASVLNLFLGASVLSLAIASVTILLFGGFVLYDTQRMLRAGDLEPVPAALSLYLNFLNLFMALLRILSSGRRD